MDVYVGGVMLLGRRKTTVDQPQQPSVGQPRLPTVACGSPLENSPRNAGKTISGGSAKHPEPAEIQNADQGRNQPVHMTKTIRSADSDLFHRIA